VGIERFLVDEDILMGTGFSREETRMNTIKYAV